MPTGRMRLLPERDAAAADGEAPLRVRSRIRTRRSGDGSLRRALHIVVDLGDLVGAIEPSEIHAGEARAPRDAGAALTFAKSVRVVAPPLADGERAVPLDEAQRRHIRATLERTAWRIEGWRGAAALLGIAPSTLRSRMRKLGIRRDRAETSGLDLLDDLLSS